MNQLTIASHNHKMQLWTSRIQECRTSNQTVADWCSENDISIKSYYYWMRKIKSEAFEALPAERKSKVLPQKWDASFAEVALIEKPRAATCAVRIHVSGLLLEIQNGADSQTVEHTLHIVFVMTGGGPSMATEMLPNYIYTQGLRYFDAGYAAALAIVFILGMSLITGVFTIARNRKFLKRKGG